MGQIDIFTTPFKTQPLKNLIRTNKKSKQKYPSFKLIFCNNLDKQEHLFFTLQQTTCLALNTRYLNFQQMQDGLRFPFDCRTALGYFLATTGSGLVMLLATLNLARQGQLLVKWKIVRLKGVTRTGMVTHTVSGRLKAQKQPSLIFQSAGCFLFRRAVPPLTRLTCRRVCRSRAAYHFQSL